jgi:hypothetical protein
MAVVAVARHPSAGFIHFIDELQVLMRLFHQR